MDITIRAHSVDLDARTREYIEDKVSRGVGKLVTGQARIEVEVSEEGPNHGAETIRVKIHAVLPHTPSSTVHAADGDVRAATDVAVDKIVRAIRKTVARKRDKARHAGI